MSFNGLRSLTASLDGASASFERQEERGSRERTSYRSLANTTRCPQTRGYRVIYFRDLPFLLYLRVPCVSDDDEEEEEEEPKEPTDAAGPTVDTEDMEATPAGSDGEAVKAEPHQSAPAKKKVRERTPSYELHIYSAEELSKFKKREMIADSELLDGKMIHSSHSFFSLLVLSRKAQEW